MEWRAFIPSWDTLTRCMLLGMCIYLERRSNNDRVRLAALERRVFPTGGG